MDKKSEERLQSVKGMYDLLPPESLRFREVERVSQKILTRYGYQPIWTPLVEYTPLFSRSIGEETDIVEKEMYTFLDRDERMLTLRPEGTASAVRAYNEHSLYKSEPVTLWYYWGPMFRHERWQRGRYRQFYQLGAEALGVVDPGIDAEMLLMLVELVTELGLKSIELHLNSLGCPECRPKYRQALIDVLVPQEAALCEDCRRRFRKNPLRVLDCKVEGCRQIAAAAPKIIDLICRPCREHWDALCGYLETLQVDYQVDNRLVRGLDYYTRTTFELISTSGSLGSQNTIAGGGRYDGLVQELSGPSTPAIGFAMGIERLMLALGEALSVPPTNEVYFVTQGEAAYKKALHLAAELRRHDILVEVDHRKASMKSQMKRAGRRGGSLTVLLGENEIEQGKVTLRDMASSSQQEISEKELVEHVQNRLGKTSKHV